MLFVKIPLYANNWSDHVYDHTLSPRDTSQNVSGGLDVDARMIIYYLHAHKLDRLNQSSIIYISLDIWEDFYNMKLKLIICFLFSIIIT